MHRTTAELTPGVIAPLRIERLAARPLERAGWRVVEAGIGAARATEAATRLLESGCRRLLVWGTAGALVASLRPGTLLLPATVIAPDASRYDADGAWRDQLREHLPRDIALAEGALATQARPIATRAEKEACARRTGAVAVDMEAAPVAALAARHGVPFVALRAIADPLELEIPPLVLGALDSRRPGLAIGLRLIARPAELGAVLRLRRAALPACRALEQAARALSALQH